MSQSKSSDQRQHLLDVMAMVASGDKVALAGLYELTSAKLFGICLRISGSRVGAEDILQDVYIKVWNSADQYSARLGSPIAWLSAIARNSAIDWRRKKHRRTFVGDDALAEIADSAPLADTVIEHDEERAKIIECLEQLADKQRQPIRSAFFGGNSYADIADKQDVPLSTMKSRIRRGLAALRECLGDG